MPKNLGTTNEVSRTSAPGSPVGGQTYHDSTTGVTYVYDAVASKWRPYGKSGGVVQTVFNQISSDTTTTSTTYVSLLTQVITTTGGSIAIFASVAASNSAANRTMDFQLLVDGVTYQGGSMRPSLANVSNGVAFHRVVAGLSAGNHTVELKWKVSASTGQIRPVASSSLEHAAMTIQEIEA